MCAVGFVSSSLWAATLSDTKIEYIFHDSDRASKARKMVQLPADSVLTLLESDFCFVADCNGNEIPSQITYDSKLIFTPTGGAQDSSKYYIHSSAEPRVYAPCTGGRRYPERADDMAWENEIVAFRAYGPATQSNGEKAFGYDIFFKHPGKGLVLQRLYDSQTNPANWHRRDSLAKIDRKLAEEYVNSFTYHIDHGLGMDCYAVGATLGDGVAALLDDGSISFPWCYSDLEILDRGPLRFTFRLDFSPRVIGADTVAEHRLISLDADSHLNHCTVWYDGLSGERDIVVGFPLRDDSPVVADCGRGILAYSDPTQGPDNGKAMLGVILDSPTAEFVNIQNHALLKRRIAPGEKFSYRWGFAWDRADITSMEEWLQYLSDVQH